MMPTDLTKKKSKPSAIRPREASSLWKIKLGKIFIKQLYIKIEEISSHMLAKGKHYMTIYIYIYIEDFVQEIGRAGRDKQPALSLLLYSGTQLRKCDKQMKAYAESRDTCLRKLLL